MCVTKSVDDVVGIVVTGAAVPSRQPRIGTELDHAERHGRAGKGVTVPARADKWIDIAREICLREDLQG